MTEPNQGPVEPPSPSWIPPQPFQNQPLDQQQGSSPPPPPLLDPARDVVWTSQGIVAPPGVRPIESKSPLIALVFGVLSWIGIPMVMGDSDSLRSLIFRIVFLLPIPAIIFGVKGRRQARQGRTSHKGMATAGIWLGAILAVPLVFFLLLSGLIFAITR